MEYKKSILDILNYLKQIGLDRRTIEKELGYKEYYLDQAISKGGNKMLLNKLKEYSARKRVMEDRMEGVIQVKDSDLGFLAGFMIERIIYLEASLGVALQMIDEVYAKQNNRPASIVSAERKKAVAMDSDRLISEWKKTL